MAAVALAAVTIAGCAGGDGAAQDGREEWVSETTVEGNVTTVRTLSGSVWGAPARLEETLSIGVEQGEAAYMFGRLAGVSGAGDRLYVLDTSIPAVRVYDQTGRHVADVGAEGDGPGEFRRPEALLVTADGRVFVRDSSQGRITVFDADGAFLETYPLDQGVMFGGTGMVMTDDGTIYSPGRVGDMPENMTFGAGGRFTSIPIGMVPRGPEGRAGEPIPQPEFDHEPRAFQQILRSGDNVMMMMRSVPFEPGTHWSMSPRGAMVAGVATGYTFDIVYPGGEITRVAMAYEPVPLTGAERDWHIEQVTAQMRDGQPDWVWEGPEMPTVKPAYEQLIADLSGRVWVGRPGPGVQNPECAKDLETGIWEPACWANQRLYDVFDLEGAYLGAIDVPAGFSLTSQSWVEGDEIVTAMEDDLGVITVKKFRLVTPAD
jgi:hypothetical protein